MNSFRSPSPRGGERFFLEWGPLLLIWAICFLIYSDSLLAGFVWDDHKLITINIRGGRPADLFRVWVSDYWQSGEESGSAYYRPLTITTFLLDYWLWGKRPAGYHLTNIILYALLCSLVWRLYLRLLPNRSLALAFTALFAALPAHTENVAWISGRTDLVCGAALFASLIFYMRGRETAPRKERFLSLFFFVLSLFAKEASIILVPVILLDQFLLHGLHRRAFTTALPFLAAGLLFSLLHFLAAPHVAEENIYTSLSAYLANIIRNLGLGIIYSVLPGGYEFIITATREEAARAFPLPAGPTLFLLLLLPASLSVAAFLALRRGEKLLALALAAGLLALLPVSGIIPIGVIFALRFLLIPSFFFVLALGLLLAKLSAASSPPPASHRTIALTAVVSIWAVIYAILSFLRVPDWRDDRRLMTSVLKRDPESALAHFLLGNALAAEGRDEEAMREFQLALASRPSYAEAEYNLGVLLQRQGRLAQAETHYRQALAIRPDFRPAREALATLIRQRESPE